MLKALRETSECLLAEFRSLDHSRTSWRFAEGEWSLRETAAHLRDAEELALSQMTAIVEGTRGPLPAWDIDVLPQERDYQAAILSRLLTEYRRLRRETTYLLWGLTEWDWNQAAEHPYRGPLTVGQIAKELAHHDLEHLWQVRRLKERLAKAVSVGEEEE